MKTIKKYRRSGVAGRVPLPGSALANHCFDGFGSKAFVKVPDEPTEEPEDVREFFPDDGDSKGDEE